MPHSKGRDPCDVYSCFVHGIPPYNWEMSERQCLHAVAGVSVVKRGISGAGTLAWGSQHSLSRFHPQPRSCERLQPTAQAVGRARKNYPAPEGRKKLAHDLSMGNLHKSEPSPAGTAKAVLSRQFTLHDLWVSGGSYEPLHNSKRVAAADGRMARRKEKTYSTPTGLLHRIPILQILSNASWKRGLLAPVI